jgi:hypothetical protein
MSNRTEAAWRKLRHCHREATVTAPLLDSTHHRVNERNRLILPIDSPHTLPNGSLAVRYVRHLAASPSVALLWGQS